MDIFSMAKMDIVKHGQDGDCKAWPRWIFLAWPRWIL